MPALNFKYAVWIPSLGKFFISNTGDPQWPLSGLQCSNWTTTDGRTIYAYGHDNSGIVVVEFPAGAVEPFFHIDEEVRLVRSAIYQELLVNGFPKSRSFASYTAEADTKVQIVNMRYSTDKWEYILKVLPGNLPTAVQTNKYLLVDQESLLPRNHIEPLEFPTEKYRDGDEVTILPGSVKWLAQTRGDLLPQLSTDNEIYTINTGRYDEMGGLVDYYYYLAIKTNHGKVNYWVAQSALISAPKFKDGDEVWVAGPATVYDLGHKNVAGTLKGTSVRVFEVFIQRSDDLWMKRGLYYKISHEDHTGRISYISANDVSELQ